MVVNTMRFWFVIGVLALLALLSACEEEQKTTGAAPYNFEPYSPEGQAPQAPAGGCGVAAGALAGPATELSPFL